MITHLRFVPEPQVLGVLKRPYDEDFHKVLKISAKKCLRFLPEDTSALITHDTVMLIASDILLKIISYFTAYANSYWHNKNLLIFDTKAWQDAEAKAEFFCNEQNASSRIKYEMYLEEHKFDIQGGLFPDYPLLPFEKTPEYYRKGVIITS